MRLDEGLATIITIGDDATDQAKEKERHEPYQPEQASPDDVAALTQYVESQVRSAKFKVILSPWASG